MVMNDSKLKLAFDELRTLYMRHLLLQQLVVKEVSLYALSLEFTLRSEKTMSLAITGIMEIQYSACYEALASLEDRHINGIVAYYWAAYVSCISTHTHEYTQQRYDNAYELLKGAPQPYELYCAGLLCQDPIWERHSNIEASYFMELAASSGYIDAFVQLANIEIIQSRTGLVHYRKAAVYCRQAVELNCVKAMMRLAYLFEYVPAIREPADPTYRELYRRAAIKGDKQALIKCVREGISL